MSKAEEADTLFKEGFSCAQSIFAVYAQKYGLDKKMALKISQAFGGSVAGMRGECGIVTGAYMVIGLAFGTSETEDGAPKIKTYEMVRTFNKRFKEVHQSTVCRELLEGRAGNQYDLCKEYIKTACEILDGLLGIKA